MPARANQVLNLLWIVAAVAGCRGYQYGHLVGSQEDDMVGSHSAGAAVYNPLIEESVGRLLGSCQTDVSSASFDPNGVPLPRRVCFVGVENKSSEELGDFKEQIYQLIDTQITRSEQFQPISRRMVEAGLKETRLRPESLLMPDEMQLFTSVMQGRGQPIDYLLFATLTSGTTSRNSSSQRDYLLTLELVDVHTGQPLKEQATIRKGYHRSPWGRLANYNIFSTGR